MTTIAPELRGNEELVVSRGPDEECLATFRIQATPGTTYWRCSLPARHLPGKTEMLEWDEVQLGDDGLYLLNHHRGTTAIWQFAGNVTRARAIDVQMHRGVRCLLEVDDNYLIPAPSLPGVKSTWNLKIDMEGLKDGDDPHNNQAHREIAKMVDGIICATDDLAEHYSRLNNNVFVCPNSADLDDWPEPEKPDDGKLRVGYSGSISHYYDSFLVEPALRWASTQNDVEVVKIGLRLNQWAFPHKEILWLDSLASYRRTLSVLDVSLCPLRSSKWANCKSDIKAIESVLAGAIPIVQKDTPVYKDWHDRTFTATTKKEWEKAVKEVVSMSQDERDAMHADLLEFVSEEKAIQRHIHKWRHLIAPQLSEARELVA